jgi:hypothetical protein
VYSVWPCRCGPAASARSRPPPRSKPSTVPSSLADTIFRLGRHYCSASKNKMRNSSHRHD